jgi:hypothetical protein
VEDETVLVQLGCQMLTLRITSEVRGLRNTNLTAEKKGLPGLGVKKIPSGGRQWLRKTFGWRLIA